jgi:hypothetical protein
MGRMLALHAPGQFTGACGDSMLARIHPTFMFSTMKRTNGDLILPLAACGQAEDIGVIEVSTECSRNIGQSLSL